MPIDRNTPRKVNPWFVALVLTALSLPVLAAPSDRAFDRRNSDRDQFLLTTTNIDGVAAAYDLEILARRGGPRSDTWLVRAPRGLDPATIVDPSVSHLEPAILASLPAVQLSAVDAMAEASADLERTGTFSSPCIDTYLGPTWSGFVDQRAAQMIRLHEGQALDGQQCGQGVTIAIIDTAIDTEHPLLAGSIVGGHDFLSDTTALHQVAEIDVRIRTIVEASEPAMLNGMATMVMLETSGVILDEPDAQTVADLQAYPPYFGHGTMVAGVSRIVAPGASIMPLRVFDDEGYGHVLDIVDAIYFAVDNGADVINMSFSMSEPSVEVQAAIEYARHHGVSTVGAAGNQGAHSVVYPAAYGPTIGVASTDLEDQLSQFTNYGLITADLAAPGNALITLYPGGAYAAGWGTSFSAPLAAGTLALLRSYHPGTNKGAHKHLRLDLLLGSTFYGYLWHDILASGRLDVVGAVAEAQ